MNGYTYFVLDDERPPIKALTAMIDEVSSLELLGTATRPAKALEKIRELQPDIVFCDINMPGLSGLEMAALLKQAPKKTVVIFTTGTKEHALDGYELGVVDYLVKPVSQKRLIEAISKASEILQHKEPVQMAKEPAMQQRIMLYEHTLKAQISILLPDILFIKSTGNYLEVVCSRDKHVVRKKLKEIIEELPVDYFVQIHKSYVVQKNMIAALKGDTLLLKTGAVLPVGPLYKAGIVDRLKMGA